MKKFLRTLRNDVLRPGKQRSDAGEQQQEQTDGKIDAVIERRADGHLASLKLFRQTLEKCSQRMQKHATSKSNYERKLDSRDAIDSRRFSAFRWSRWRR